MKNRKKRAIQVWITLEIGFARLDPEQQSLLPAIDNFGPSMNNPQYLGSATPSAKRLLSLSRSARCG